jgi:hypothetical protein
MVNNEKVKLMTQIALFEKKEKRKSLRVNKFYRGDFICIYFLKAFLFFTLAYGLGVGMWCLYNIETLISQTDLTYLLDVARTIIMWYLIALIPFLTIVYLTYWVRYSISRKKIKPYQKNLKALKKWYSNE